MADYRRFPPPEAQRGIVEHYWMIEAPGAVDGQREILIPNGRPAVVVALAEPGVRHDPLAGTTWANNSVLFGITTRPFVRSQSGPSSYVGAELKPWCQRRHVPRCPARDRGTDAQRP